MAFTLSRYLRLRLDSNLTANARYNLERLDLLGSTFVVDSISNLNIRSESDIIIEPQSADVGGDGTGGTVSIGTSAHTLDSLNIYASDVTFSNSPGLLDQGTGGTKYLRLKYDSTLSGSVDTAADRILSFDLQGANRSLVLGASLVFPANSAGYMTNDGSGTLSWVPISGGGDVLGATGTWAAADGTSKAFSHSLGSEDVEVMVLDENDEIIMVDSIVATTTNIVTLTSSEAPAVAWRIIVQAK